MDSEIPSVSKLLRMSEMADSLMMNLTILLLPSLTRDRKPAFFLPKAVNRLRWAANLRERWEGSTARGMVRLQHVIVELILC